MKNQYIFLWNYMYMYIHGLYVEFYHVDWQLIGILKTDIKLKYMKYIHKIW